MKELLNIMLAFGLFMLFLLILAGFNASLEVFPKYFGDLGSILVYILIFETLYIVINRFTNDKENN